MKTARASRLSWVRIYGPAKESNFSSPGNTFHTARLIGHRRWFLGASTEWPGVLPTDVEIGNVEELAAQYPVAADTLRTIAASVRIN